MTSVFEAAWENLPEEVWINHILVKLSVGTLSTIALVSKKLNKLATDPLLWISKENSFKIKKEKIIGDKPVMRFLNIPRFSKIKHLDLSADGRRRGSCRNLSLDFAKDLFMYILSDDCRITSLDLSYVNLHSSNGEGFIEDEQKELIKHLVGSAIAKLELSNLTSFMLETQHSSPNHSFFTAILQEIKTTSHHQSVDFSCFDFIRVNPSLFAEAIVSLKRAKLLDCKLTSAHLTALFALLNKQKTTSLITLITHAKSVGPENPPEELAGSISKLKHIQICNLRLDQTRALIEAVPNSNLEAMSVYGLKLIGIPMQFIRSAVQHLNRGKNVKIPGRCSSFRDQFPIWSLLSGNDIPGYFFEGCSSGKPFKQTNKQTRRLTID